MIIFFKLQAKWRRQLKFSPRREYGFSHSLPVHAKGSSTTKNEVVATGPWGPQIPYINQLFLRADELYRDGPPKYYPDQTVADAPALLTDSQNLAAQQLGGSVGTNQSAQQLALQQAQGAGGNPLTQTSQALLPALFGGVNTAQGAGQGLQAVGSATAPASVGAILSAIGQQPQQFQSPTIDFSPSSQLGGQLQQSLLGSGMNPYLDQVVDAALRNSNRQFNTEILPGIRTAANAAGQGGGLAGGGEGIAAGLASQGLAQQQGDVIAQIMSNAFNQGSAERQNALGLLSQGLQANQQTQLGTNQLNQQGQQTAMQQALAAAGLGNQALQQGSALSLAGAGQNTGLVSDLMSQGNQQGLQQFYQSLGLLPQLQAGNLANMGFLNNVGLQQMGLNQAQIDADMERYFWDTLAPYNALAQYQNFITGPYGSSVPLQGIRR